MFCLLLIYFMKSGGWGVQTTDSSRFMGLCSKNTLPLDFGGWLPVRLSFTPLLLPASGGQTAPQGVPPQEAARPVGTHPSTAARLRHPDRTTGAASRVGTKD